MTAGKGFMPGAMIFGRWSRSVRLAQPAFGFATAAEVLSIVGSRSSQFMLWRIPGTLFASRLAGTSRAPAADGIPYIKS